MRKTYILIAALLAAPLVACGQSGDETDVSEGEEAAADDYERGPHNGRMLRDGDFAIEVTVFEEGVPPEYRLYDYRDGEPIDRSEEHTYELQSQMRISYAVLSLKKNKQI